MKIGLTIAFSLLTVISVLGQSFEGKIIYSNSYKSKNSKMTDQQWTTMMGSNQEYLIKNGDYKTISNGTFVQWQLYVNKENKLYSKMSNSETAFWNDASAQDDEILNVEVNKEVTELLGYTCDELILTCKSGVQKYYFNSNLAVDTKLFENHKYGNWFDYLSKTNSLPLKSVIETDQFTMESIAIAVQPMEVEAKFFEIPKGVKTDKNPY